MLDGRASQPRVRRYFALVLALSVPFWLVELYRPTSVAPGLPLSALMAIVPGLVATLLIWIDDGAQSALTFLRRAFARSQRGAFATLLPALLLMPLFALCAYGVLAVMHRPLPNPIAFPVLRAPAVLCGALLFAFTEELGWSAFAFERLTVKFAPFAAALIVGIAWMTWHVVPYVQAHRDVHWIAWQCLNGLALRIISASLYIRSEHNLFIAALFHWSINAAWLAFPNYGSHYDPRVSAIFAVLGAAAFSWLGRNSLFRCRAQ